MDIAFKATGGIGLFVLLETQKPLLLRQAWMLAAFLLGFHIVLTAVASMTGGGLTDDGSNDIGAGEVGRNNTTESEGEHTAKTISLIGVIGLVAASLVGWWVCNNKKDDLVMMRAVARFKELLEKLDAAEKRLRGALDTMLACDTDMQTISNDIQEAAEEAKAQLEFIRKRNEKAMTGTRRLVLNRVLVSLADLDGSMKLGQSERVRLFELVGAMSDMPLSEMSELRASLRLEDAQLEVSNMEVLDLLEQHQAFDVIMGLDSPEVDESPKTSTHGSVGERRTLSSEI